MIQKINACLRFDNQGEEAVKFYTSIFKNSKVLKTSYYPEGTPGPVGKVMTIKFQLDGVEFMALNGGPVFKFNEAISLVVNCENQKEIDELWEKLSAGGKVVECGWLQDKYGLSWQIVPATLEDMLTDPDKEKVQRVMQEVLKMKKLDLKILKEAYEGTLVH